MANCNDRTGVAAKRVAEGVFLEDVTYDSVREVNDSATVEYVGTLVDLHAAGCIDAETFQLFTATRKRMLERYRPHWWITRRRNYEEPNSWRVHLVFMPRELAITLPGVADFPVVNRVAAAKIPATLARELESPGGMRTHSRPIGRKQHMAEWVTLENVIWIRFPQSNMSRYLDGKPAA